MPLDSHGYLVSQGWSGKGTALRKGAISRPIAVSQKKTLSGLGKDRDEAFPFWDHVFNAASKTINIKIFNDDADGQGEEVNEATILELKRTSTGIISNRRPTVGSPAQQSSGTSTPSTSRSTLNVLAQAKRDAARQGLYSRFFRGPVLGPDEEPSSSSSSGEGNGEVGDNGARDEGKKEKAKFKSKKSKGKKAALSTPESCQNDVNAAASDETRQEKKRRKKEAREAKKLIRDMVVASIVQEPRSTASSTSKPDDSRIGSSKRKRKRSFNES